MQNDERNVKALGWTAFANDVASEMLYPILPGFLTGILKATPAALGLIEGVADATSSLVRIPAGRLSDRASRRKPLAVAGYTLANLVRPLIALASAWSAVLWIRFADRAGKGLRTPPRDALLAASVAPEARGRAFGKLRAMDHAGAVVGPLITMALMGGLGLPVTTIFWLSLIPGAAAVGIMAFVVREPRPSPPIHTGPGAAAGSLQSEQRILSSSERLPLPRVFYAYTGIVGVFALGNSTDAFLLLRLASLGLPAWGLALVWSAFHVVKAAFSALAGGLSDRLGRRPLIVAGWAVYAASYLGFALTTSLPLALGCFGLYGLYFALVEGPEKALVADLVPDSGRGSAFGVFSAVNGLAALPASLLFGVLWSEYGVATAFCFGAALAAIAAVALGCLRLTPSPRPA